MLNIAIIAENSANLSAAIHLAQELNLPLLSESAEDYSAYLRVGQDGLKLQLSSSRMKAISVEFSSGALAHRCQYGGGKSQLIAKAIGLKNKKHLSVIDLTAGLGRDAYVLAHLGCSVTMVERSPIIAALLRDGLMRAELLGNLAVKKLQLINQDAIDFLEPVNSEKPEVIYLDPMFTELDKSALVKKEMRILRHIVGDDLDAGKLLDRALAFGSKRVVVKRARLAPCLNNTKPSQQLIGKSTRFDIYLP